MPIGPIRALLAYDDSKASLSRPKPRAAGQFSGSALFVRLKPEWDPFRRRVGDLVVNPGRGRGSLRRTASACFPHNDRTGRSLARRRRVLFAF